MRRRTGRSDAGFTMIEVITAGAVVAVVLAATTTFFIQSMISINLQGARQAAVQLATDAMEQLRAVPGSLALNWLQTNASPPDQTRNNLTYATRWSCTDADSLITCGVSSLMLEPAVTVSFQGKGCGDTGVCSYTTRTRISVYSVDPIFQVNP